MPTSLYGALTKRALQPTWAEDSITADLATDTEAELLEVEPGTPVLRVARRAKCHDVVVEVSRATYRADRFTMFVQVGHEE
ncbi:MAG: UTRA domain-containing protein, partial [Nocardioidaceae bacterium]